MAGPEEDPPSKTADEDDAVKQHSSTSSINNDTVKATGNKDLIDSTNGALASLSTEPSIDSDDSGSKTLEKSNSSSQGVSESDAGASQSSDILPSKSGLPIVKASSCDEKKNTPDEASSGMNKRQLVRGLALCGDDDTKLRPPPPLTLQRHPHSLSRDSSGTDYTDSSGLDLKAFIANTLHKNQRDRQMILQLEEQLTKIVNDNSIRAFKFPAMSSYNRMLIHRTAAVFGLDHNVDNSGQCIVVTKTDRTTIPDFDFSSLILHDNFSDNKLRAYDSHEEISSMGYSGYDVSYPRRAQSFETTNFIANTANWVNQQANRSFDGLSPSHPDTWVDRSAYLRKAGSFGGVPTYYRGTNNIPVDSSASMSQVNFSSNGSVHAQLSSRDKVDELSENMKVMQIAAHPQGHVPQAPSPGRDMMYGNPAYQQPMYIQQRPMVAPQMYSPIPGNMPPNMTMPSVHYAPVPSMMIGSWGAMQYGYHDPNIVQQPMPTHAMPSSYQQPSPGHYVLHHTVPTQYHAPYTVSHHPPTYQQHPQHQQCPVSTNISSSGSHQGMMASVDGGYGSMTQDSLRDSEFAQE